MPDAMNVLQPRPLFDASNRTAGTLACPDCRGSLSGGERFCPACGHPQTSLPFQPAAPQIAKPPEALPASPPPSTNTPVTPPPANPPLPPSTNVICAVCGQVLPTDARFCYRCGRGIEPAKPSFWLVWTGADKRQQTAVLTDREVVIGAAADCGVALAGDEYISRNHACIFLGDGKLHVADLGSTNGTFLRIRSPRALEVGDELFIGATVLRIEQH
jgi:RNA polymerase subunit RPABC4/transcription elongation factor Spt4